MNKEHRKRITQNLTYLKERMLDLDPLLDCLIERDVFQLEHRSRIDAATPPTPQRKFNEFIQLLLSSSHPAAYHAFLEALQNERQFYVVERLQNTVVKLDNASMRAKTPHKRQPVQTIEPALASGYAHMDQVASVMSKVLSEFSGKLTEELVTNFEKRREDDIREMEENMEAKLGKFSEQWEHEKKQMLLQNDSAIKSLQDGIESLQRKQNECEKLKLKYDQLKQHQKDLREKENERWQKLTQSNLENSQLKAENTLLKEEIDRLKDKIEELQDEASTVRKGKLNSDSEAKHLLTENRNLRTELDEKEKERDDLKRDIENAYERIHEIIRVQKEKSTAEDSTYKTVLDKQNQKLSEIYDAVNALSARDRLNQIKSSGAPRTLFIGGNAVQRSNRSNKS
ncbi:girdin-like [Mytilus trossulus]|uniref:girdin-like n=1 Tax=Mytilus trossulus TaxID=6551 RepID=UPI003007360C